MIPGHSDGPSSSEKSWIAGLAGHSKNLHSPKKLDSWRHVGVVVSGRGSWHSLVAVTLLGDRGHSTKQFDLLLHATLPAPKRQ